MPKVESLFATHIYRASLSEYEPAVDIAELEKSCRSIAEDDEAGQIWCEESGYPGYTSYASLADLPWRFPVFSKLVEALDKHVFSFVEALEFDLEGGNLKVEDLWINILPQGGSHPSHVHPNSVVSGTAYVSMPDGASSLCIEDPRSERMMAAPYRKADAKREMKRFVYLLPRQGEVLLWESWLRHGVPLNRGEGDRISVSFNYVWE
ncbi:MAG: TIGR02466 family protein [Roseovarius sp.]|nr:TIGR02466 family protein [Roseovarius sp.]